MVKFVISALVMTCAVAQQPAAGVLGTGPVAAASIKNADGTCTVIATSLHAASAPITVWRAKCKSRILARLDDGQLLLQLAAEAGSQEPGALHALNPKSGQTRELARCWWDQKVDIHNGRLVKFAATPERGYPLESVGLLPNAKPTRIGKAQFVWRSHAHGNQIIAVETDYRAVYRIDLRRNTCDKLFEPSQGACGITFDRSPGGQRIVLGIARYDGGEIVVLDAATGNVVRRWTKLQIRSDLFVPELPTGFVDDDVIAGIETGKRRKTRVEHFRVTRSISTGKELKRTLVAWDYSWRMDKERSRRDKLLGQPTAWTPQRAACLRQLREEPSLFVLSPDEKHAIVQRDQGGDIQLLGNGAPIVLGSGKLLDCRWLPAAGSCATDHSSGRPHTRYSPCQSGSRANQEVGPIKK